CAVPGGITTANLRSPAGTGAVLARLRLAWLRLAWLRLAWLRLAWPGSMWSRLTCLSDQDAASAWSRARQAASCGDIRAALRRYQPSRERPGSLISAPGGHSPGCRTRRWSRAWWRAVTQARWAWARRSEPLRRSA